MQIKTTDDKFIEDFVFQEGTTKLKHKCDNICTLDIMNKRNVHKFLKRVLTKYEVEYVAKYGDWNHYKVIVCGAVRVVPDLLVGGVVEDVPTGEFLDFKEK